MLRFVGFQSVTLAAGESRAVTLKIDPRLLGNWAGAAFQVAAGDYEFAVGRSAVDLPITVTTRIPAFRASLH
jgi:beta-glucosidase